LRGAPPEAAQLSALPVFKIGDFSRIARVSARQLRFYDEIGLLKPAQADPFTGYRFYTAAQLAQLNRILVLKELGFPLEEIGRIVNDNPSASDLRAMLLLRRNDAERALAAETERLRLIETRIRQIEGDGEMSGEDVIVRAEPARRVLSLRRVLPSFAAALATVGETHALVRRCVPSGELGTLVVIAHAQEFESDRLDAEFGFTLPDGCRAKLDPKGELTLRELEPVPRMAVAVRIGLPEEAHLCTAQIGRYLAASGEELAGPSREYFLRLPATDRMQDAVVEMQFPIRRIEP
jgi:DNA-binding transcriptional MerR regulator